MAQKGDRKPLSPRQIQAAIATADDHLTDVQIAANAGVTRPALDKWRKRDDFQAKVAEARAAIIERAEAEGIANPANRIAAGNERWRALREIVAARAADPEYQRQPGGKTGYLVKTTKLANNGDQVDEFSLDKGLLSELRDLEKHVATQLEQWHENQKTSVDVKQEIEIRYVNDWRSVGAE